MLDDESLPSREVLESLPVFPLPNAVLLPGMVLPLNVFEPRYLELVDHVVDGCGHIGVPLLRPGYQEEYGGRPAIERNFGIGRLVSHQRLPNGRRFIRLQGLGRVRAVNEHEPESDFRQFAVEALPELPVQDTHQVEVLKAQLERICSTLDGDDTQMVGYVLEIPDPRVMVYAITAIMPTLGYSTHAEAERGGRAALLDLQQRCLDAETTDARVAALIGCAAEICDELAGSGRWPKRVWN